MNALCNISCNKSREVAASLLDRFLSRRCFTLCITMKAEPRIAKQHKCHYCCSCKNYWGKGMEGGKKVSLRHFRADQKIMSSWKKMCFGASYSMSNKLLLVARYTLWAFKNVFKVGSVKFANSLSPPSSVKKYAPEVKAAKGLKRCWANIKGINNPPELPNRQQKQYKWTVLFRKRLNHYPSSFI